MKTYKAELKLISALGTELAADTIFGHICWSMFYSKGEGQLQDFLKKMESSNPPILICDPYPSGFMPVPILPCLTRQQRDKIFKECQGKEDKDIYNQVKNVSKCRWISSEKFNLCKDNFSSYSVVSELLKENRQEKNKMAKALSPHNKIDRLAGGTIQGGVFFTEDIYFDSSGARYDMIIGSDEYSNEDLLKILRDAFAGGYGRDKSTGKGVIEVEKVSLWQLPKAENPNAVMLLGPCVPFDDDPIDGFWAIKAKSGKLGGDWAITEHPHKKTLMMLQSGSVMLTDKPKPFYGKMVHNIHSQLTQVVHYGISLSVPIKVNLQYKEAV